MNLSSYKLLGESEQFEIIEQKGVFLAEREEGFYTIRLYQIDGFYAEIFCHSHFNVIVRTRAFASVRALQPYLKAINVADLLTDI